jgi:putative oxidoreductase
MPCARTPCPGEAVGGRAPATLLAAVLAAVFIATGLAKLVEPSATASAIARYALAPPMLVRPLAIVLPWWEVYAGVALLLPRWRRPAALLVAALAAGFGLVAAITLLRGIAADCGCLGPLSARLGWGHVLADGLLVAGAVLVARRSRGVAEA